MKQHPEALNYSWDGSQQTLNSTWGNTAVTLQLILLLNPAADCLRESVCVFLSSVCVRVCFLYLSETCSDEALTHTRSHAGSFKPTNSMCQEKQQVSPFSSMLKSGRLIWHTEAQTESTHMHTLQKHSHSCWSESAGVKWDDKVPLPLVK